MQSPHQSENIALQLDQDDGRVSTEAGDKKEADSCRTPTAKTKLEPLLTGGCALGGTPDVENERE